MNTSNRCSPEARASESTYSVDAAIMRFIDCYWMDHWTSPTVREIATHVSRSPAVVHTHLRQLVWTGKLERHQPSPARVLYRCA